PSTPNRGPQIGARADRQNLTRRSLLFAEQVPLSSTRSLTFRTVAVSASICFCCCATVVLSSAIVLAVLRGSRCPTVLDGRHGQRGRNRLRHCARKIWDAEKFVSSMRTDRLGASLHSTAVSGLSKHRFNRVTFLNAT